jgi:hypothetical protein
LISVAAIVEGYGDVRAIPTLVVKTGLLFGLNIVAANPIRSGEWKSLRVAGELERFLELARTRDRDLILIILDLDDSCCKTEYESAMPRINKWINGRNIVVHLVFMVKEYECIFLSRIQDINPAASIVDEPERIRDAKGKLKTLTGRRYRETQDQEGYTKAINLPELIKTSRSYRKLAKEISGKTYAEIDEAFG